MSGKDEEAAMREPTVSAVMTTRVIAVAPQTSFKDVVATLSGNGISAVPVIGEKGALIGVVSEADVLPKQEFHGGADPAPHGVARRRMRYFRSLGLCAAELMSTPVITIGPEAPVTLAARRLAEHRVRRLFVVDAAGTLVGVVSRRDIMAMFLRSDDEIRAEIKAQVLDRALKLPAGPAVRVEVLDGVAVLDGELDRRSQVELAIRLTRRVPGVVSVRNNLSYHVDDLAPMPTWTGFSP
jgi:CBS domain-containing protein